MLRNRIHLDDIDIKRMPQHFLHVSFDERYFVFLEDGVSYDIDVNLGQGA